MHGVIRASFLSVNMFFQSPGEEDRSGNFCQIGQNEGDDTGSQYSSQRGLLPGAGVEQHEPGGAEEVTGCKA